MLTTCTSCGVSLTLATSYVSEQGPVCSPCLGRVQSRLEQANRSAEEVEASLTRRGRVLAGAHGTMWGVSVILATQWAPLPPWLSTLLLIAVAALVIGLAFRARWSYWVALGIDAAAVPALGAWAARHFWPLALVAVFPVSLVLLTRTLRVAYQDDAMNLRPAAHGKRWWAAVVMAAALGGAGLTWTRRPPPDPTLEMMRTVLPAWQAARGRPGSTENQLAARELVARARPWPALAGAFTTLDRVWPDADAVHAAVKSVNQALTDARLPYFINTYAVAERPYVLSYQVDARVPWRVGARTVEVVRLRRLDTLNLELGLFGSTEAGLPVVMLDRIEAMLATELPVMFGSSAAPRSDRNDFDRTALARVRVALEARLGPHLADAAAALGARERLLEQMRTRLHGNEVHLAAPDGFVLGDAWLESIEPETNLTRPGGPLVLDTDLREVARADRKLREGPTIELLRAAVDIMALSTESHEARHALDEVDPVGPPPPALFEVMPSSSTAMIGMADKELRAILGELHDAAMPVCATLAEVSRNVYGRWARRNPHFFAILTILGRLDPDSDLEPAEQLTMLCAVPDAELRRRIVVAWEKLYGTPMPSAVRSPTP